MNRGAGKSIWMFLVILAALIAASVALFFIYLTPANHDQGQPSPHALQQDE